MKQTRQLVRRGFLMHLVLMVVSLIFVLSMGGWWAFAFSLAFIAGTCMYAMNDGAYIGEKAVGMQKLIERQKAEGRDVPPERYAEAYNRGSAIRAYVYTVLPFLILACVNYALLGSFEEGTTNWLNVAVSILFLPYMQLFSPWMDSIAPEIIRLCYIPASLIVPAFLMVGYLRGPVYHERKLKEMMKGSRKKKKRLRVNAKPRKDRNQPEI